MQLGSLMTVGTGFIFNLHCFGKKDPKPEWDALVQTCGMVV